MPKPRIDYRPHGQGGMSCSLISGENMITVTGSPEDPTPTVDGSDTLRANYALVNELWACAMHEFQYRRLRSPEKRESHAKQCARHGRNAIEIARMVENLGSRLREEWCSACFTHTAHRQVKGYSRPVLTFLCGSCGSPTTPCAAVRCGQMANRRIGSAAGPAYCAEHRHDIPAFDRLDNRLDHIGDYEEWLRFQKRDVAKGTKVLAIAAVTGLAVAPAAFVAAPLVGGATGALTGLSGAAATSHGLAIWGGGSLAAGGLGMAGGTFVITAVGAGLGGVLGAVSTTAYVRSDRSFRIEKLKDGSGSPVLLAHGFLTEGRDGWGDWQALVDARYHENPVYRVHWGAKELKDLGVLAAGGAGRQAAVRVLRGFAAKAGRKAAKVPGIGTILLAADVSSNPWSVAKNRAAMTGAVLADLIARTDEGPFILIGHSLGARVMVTAAQALGTTGGPKKLESVHLLGAAVGAKGDWRTLNDSVSGVVWNYRSTKDNVLKYVYRSAQLGYPAVGVAGFQSKFPQISDVDLSRQVDSHTAYFTSRMRLR